MMCVGPAASVVPCCVRAGERQALRARMQDALFVESVDNGGPSPFCMLCACEPSQTRG